MIDITRLRQLALALAIAIACCTTTALALPPLGLTQISTSAALRPNLEIIDGTAYLGVSSGVWSIDSFGTTLFVPISHPTLGTPDSVTRLVKATDGELYVAANFDSFTNQAGAALFQIGQPTTPIVTWELPRIRVRGVDISLRTFGGFDYDDGDEATQFLLNGSTIPLPYPLGSDSSNNITRLASSTPNGYAIGDAGVPGTIGSAPGVWAPTGEFSFLDGSGFATSIRDRIDQQGVNLGWNDIDPVVKYGNTPAMRVRNQFGGFIDIDDEAIVSQSDFVVINGNVIYGYYPGIIPNFPDRAVPMLDIFPELTTVDIDVIHDLASVDGYLYMTLSGSDGTFLFGARDLSVIVPEPTTALLILAAIPWLYHRQTLVRNA